MRLFDITHNKGGQSSTTEVAIIHHMLSFIFVIENFTLWKWGSAKKTQLAPSEC